MLYFCIQNDNDMSNPIQGLVIKNTGSHYVVQTTDGACYDCKVKGNFRIKGIRTTNPVAVGDRVDINLINDTTGYITAIRPRHNYIIRRASNLSKESHILAANIDQVFLIVTLTEPVTPLTFIDRFLATARAYRIPAFIVINKVDLLDDDDSKEYLGAVAYLYRSIGYEVIETSAVSGLGIDMLREKLIGKISLISGNSGVGKSTLINAIVPDANLRTGEISTTHHTGMHTTTFSQMIPLPAGGNIIDTPGVKGFGTVDFKPDEIGHFFPEIFEISKGCRFGNCSHTHEPGCAVRQALADHRISESRYNSYLSILEDVNPDKYRKPF